MIQPFDLVEIINETLAKGDRGYIEYLMEDNRAMVILERDGDWTVLHTKDLKKIGEKVLSQRETVDRLEKALSKLRYGMKELMPIFPAAIKDNVSELSGLMENASYRWRELEREIEEDIEFFKEQEGT